MALPTQLKQLSPAPFNPRQIDEKAKAGLNESIDQFGDLSGLVFNFSTGNLVAGHQRREELLALGAADIEWSDEFQTKHGEERLGKVRLTDGSVFTIRGVQWPIEKEKAANVAANNPLIAGTFTTGLISILADIEGTEYGKGLRFDELPSFLPEVFGKPGKDDSGDGEEDGERDESPSGGGVKLVSLFYDDEDMNEYMDLVMRAKGRFAASTPSAAVLEVLRFLDAQGELPEIDGQNG